MKLFALALGMFAFVSCGGDTEGDAPAPKSKITLTTNNNSFVVNTPITFTITDSDGSDLTADAIIYHKYKKNGSNYYDVVENPFTPTEDGEYTFFAHANKVNSNNVTVNVVPTIPSLPDDTQLDNTSFYHRILLIDHTGTTCGYCPNMMAALKTVEETEGYHEKYYEAMSHTYNGGDPAGSPAANSVSAHYSFTGYPSLTYNFYHSVVSSYNAEHIMGQIDALWKADGADAGIAATASTGASYTVINTEVKAAVENEYHITAWLLEDGIYAKQTNATEEWMNTHNNAIRQIIESDNITGFDLGTIAAGEKKSAALVLKIAGATWVRENFKVLVIVSAKNAKGKFEVANVIMCPANGSVSYEYNDKE